MMMRIDLLSKARPHGADTMLINIKVLGKLEIEGSGALSASQYGSENEAIQSQCEIVALQHPGGLQA